MKKTKKVCLVFIVTFTFVVLLMYIPVWMDDAKARENKAKVRELVSVGQKLSEAETILRIKKYTLRYEKPIASTYGKSYLQQLVIVGNIQPNLFETIAYASGS
jgi:hypothetical protein